MLSILLSDKNNDNVDNTELSDLLSRSTNQENLEQYRYLYETASQNSVSDESGLEDDTNPTPNPVPPSPTQDHTGAAN
jgi:hypothetical protein